MTSLNITSNKTRWELGYKLNVVLKTANILADLNHMIYLNSKKKCLVNMMHYIFCAIFKEYVKYLSIPDLPKNYFGSLQPL